MTDRAQWLAERRKGIGASDAAAVLGLSPNRTPLDVWLSKTQPHMLEPCADEDFLEFGTEVEAPIERRYIRDTGNQVYHPTPAIIVHPKYPEIICTPDGLCDSPERIVVEYKFERFSNGFGDPGTDEVPDHFLVQGSHQMACCDRGRVDFGLLHGAPPIRIYRAYRDLDLENELIDRLRSWWADHVVKDVEPPIDSSLAWSQYLARKYPRNQGKMLTADNSIQECLVSLLGAVTDLEAEEGRVNECKNKLRDFIGDNDGIIFPDGSKVTWKKEKDTVKDVTNWEAVVEALCDTYPDISQNDLKAFTEANTQKGVVTRTGARKLLISEGIKK